MLPKWVNFSIIIVLVFVVASMFIFALNTTIDLGTFFKKYDNRIKLADQRYQADKTLTENTSRLAREAVLAAKDAASIADKAANTSQVLSEGRTPMFADMLHNQRVMIANQYLIGQQQNITGISNDSR